MTFQESLTLHLEKLPDASWWRTALEAAASSAGIETSLTAGRRGRRERRLLAFLKMPESDWKRRRVAKLEAHTRKHMGWTEGVVIDWLSGIDWFKVLPIIIGFFMLLIAL
jgi:hypothetical protein